MQNYKFITSHGFKKIIRQLYGSRENVLPCQTRRYEGLINSFRSHFHTEPGAFYSTPGRIEIGGNHTDHNHGRVLAAGITLDSIAAASKTDDQTITLFSEGYTAPFIIDLSRLSPVKSEIGKTQALIRGIASHIKNSGYAIGGFQASMTSDVLPGSGLSSSASIEVLIGTILNDLYNGNTISSLDLAISGKYAENNYFGKPCGLMDQVACATGGIASIDFADPHKPVIEKIEYDFHAHGYQIIVVDTGGCHVDLTRDYAAVPGEMKKVASLFHKEVCREITKDDVIRSIKDIRREAGDRAVLRAFHFLDENQRVPEQVKALKNNNLKRFLTLITESGNSSWKWLQNTYSPAHPEEQGIPLALSLTEQFIQETGNGACRVHGGGFAGTILAFIPVPGVEEYRSLMQGVFGEKAVKILAVRDKGTTRVWS